MDAIRLIGLISIVTLFSLGFIFPQIVIAQEEEEVQEQIEIVIPTKPITGLRSVFVERVIDGDTIITDMEERIRYIGMDTPETKHPSKPVEFFGAEASKKNVEFVEGKTVELEFDVEELDRYGRTLAYIWLGDEMINAKLLSEGYAQIATYPPNVRYVDYFLSLQEEARLNLVGLWAFEDDDPVFDELDNETDETEEEPISSDSSWLWWLGGVGFIAFWVYKWVVSRNNYY